MKKNLLPVLAALALFTGRAHAAEAAVPLVNLVGDNASLVMDVTDLPALVKSWPGTPWMKMWRDDQVQRYFAPLRAQLKVDEWDERCKANTGYTVADLLDLATGEAIFVMPDLGAVIDAAKSKTAPPLLVAIAIGGNGAKIEKLIADEEAKDKESKLTETTEDFNGVTLHIVGSPAQNGTVPPPPGIWAISGGVFYVSPSKDFLEQTLAAAKQGGHDNPLGKSDGFMQMRQRVGDAQIILYANLKAMYPAAQKAIAGQKAPGAAGQPVMSPFDPTTILHALGLDAANELYLTANVGGTSTDMNFGFTYQERRGLAKLAEYTDGAPPRPSFVPGKCFSVFSARGSLKNAEATLEGMVTDISPLFFGIFQGYIKSLNDRFGLDLKRDLLGNLGDQWVMASALNDEAPADAPIDQRINQLCAVSLANDTAFTAAVESIKRGTYGEGADKVFEKRAYLGHDIYTYVPPQPPAADGAPPAPARPGGFSYAVAGHWVFLGSPALIENALQGLDGKQASFWDKDEVKRNLLADLPDNARYFSYADLGKIVPEYFNAVVQGMETSRKMAAARAQRNQPADGAGQAEPPADADKPMVDDSAKPDAATLAKYWGYSRAYGDQDANGTYLASRIIYPNNP